MNTLTPNYSVVDTTWHCVEFVFFEDTALVHMCNKCDNKVRNDGEIYFFKQAFYLFYKTSLFKTTMSCV